VSAPNAGDLLNAIHSSRGMAHINRSHQRTFTLNIFRMNAQELIEITRRVNDPDEGLRLMSMDNREAGQQTHREVTRRVHNFVAAALTLVEHTRIFMREHYGDTPTFDQYQTKVVAEFAQDPLVRFVQDMRNFMLHRGLPNSEMFMNFESNPDLPTGGGELTTGIRIRAAPLLEWRNWSGPAETFIENSGEFVDIRAFAEDYTDKIVVFHDWLQVALDQLHTSDLDELRALQRSLDELDRPAPSPSSAADSAHASQENVDEPEQEFVFASSRAAALDTAATELFSKVREREFPKERTDGFASERPVGATLTDKEIIGEPLVWADDVEGRRVFVFAYKGKRGFGIDENVFAGIQTLIEAVLKSDWATRTVSRSFIEKSVIQWLQSKVNAPETGTLSETIAKASRDSVQPLELWAPIAHLEVQASFAIGPVEIVTITKAMVDGLEAKALSSAPKQHDSISALFNKLREDMQGLAAVVFKANGEPEKIKEDGEAIARIVVELLRFASPAATNFPMTCASALLGSEVVPNSNLLVLGEGTFVYTQAALSPMPDWRVSEAVSRGMQKYFDAVGGLVRPEGLSAFALAVRTSLLLFGRGRRFQIPSNVCLIPCLLSKPCSYATQPNLLNSPWPSAWVCCWLRTGTDVKR
jgi:hypothetical protein